MSYAQKKFVDAEGLQHFAEKLNEYPNNEVLATVINAIEEEIPEVPVQDVQINGTSILNNGVANIPVASASTFGVAKTNVNNGITITNSGELKVVGASNNSEISNGRNLDKPIVPYTQHSATFYGLAKAAGDTSQSQSANTVGNYTDSAKSAIQSMLGITQMLAPENPNLVASQAYAIGDVFAANGHLYKATAAIAQDGTIIPDTNCVETSVGEGFVKFTDYATSNKGGTIKVSSNWLGTNINSEGYLFFSTPSGQIKQGNGYPPITINSQHEATFYGLAKVAGADEKNSTLPVGQYTDTAKSAIRTMIGASSTNVIAVQDTQPTDSDTKIWIDDDASGSVQVPTVSEMESALAGKVSDVQVNGVSVVTNGVANVPIGSTSTLGVVKCASNGDYGIGIYGNGILTVTSAGSNRTKAGISSSTAITPNIQHEATFYGLAKAAGADMAQSDNAVGTYTDAAKTAIKNMIGVEEGLKVVRLI